MPTCIVCLGALKDPAALPCGHVFCWDCLIRLIRSVTPYTNHHFCPTCKQPYTISNVDPTLVPHHLQPFITPSVRKLHLEYTIPAPTKGASASNAEYEKLLAENVSLKACCFIWRKRAAVHASATLGLVGLARIARDYALRIKSERDELETRYNELKKRYDENMSQLQTPPETPPSPRSAQLRASSPPVIHLPHISELRLEPLETNLQPSLKRTSPAPRPLSTSVYRMPSPAMSDVSYFSDCPDCVEKKRKRSSEPDETEEDVLERPIKRSHSSSPGIVSPAPAPATASPERSIASYLEGTLTI
ncbi:hypothetical protein DICSQDRAFT_145081 [Dichomitus squalens LYAD-421 SS1]|uniref:uncharacterized protein n=1 Tax=Dichomitus squalens (strain LYAD-421) TaxID=732165 RepID=UPI0004415DB4|nr:uncharacterized protein DICSQDRAFT_145081 [Dichomitus squalens LYAD-421 SS1]EJF64436.1 hypothetical protein DICSQDRAFT_145081 [Dichomitus squalens LYAD-421 SS1]